MSKTYEDGLNEAWELAKRIICLRSDGGEPAEWLENVFGASIPAIVMRKYSASEAIKQVKEYEEIKVGDEVEYIITSDRGVVEHISQTTQQIDVMWGNGSIGEGIPIKRFKKTG